MWYNKGSRPGVFVEDSVVEVVDTPRRAVPNGIAGSSPVTVSKFLSVCSKAKNSHMVRSPELVNPVFLFGRGRTCDNRRLQVTIIERPGCEGCLVGFETLWKKQVEG